MGMGERVASARPPPRLRDARRLLAGLSAALVALLGAGRDGVGGDLIITEYRFPTPNSVPLRIAAGSDGALWFTEGAGRLGDADGDGDNDEDVDGDGDAHPGRNSVGRMTTAGSIKEFPILDGLAPLGIAAGPDGSLWFTESAGNRIGRITTAGEITEFPIPTSASSPLSIAAGRDGSLWFTEQSGNKIGRIATDGTFMEFSLATADSSPQGIAAGPDGDLWFTESAGNRIGRVTTAGKSPSFKFPRPPPASSASRRGPMAASGSPRSPATKIGRVAADGSIVEFPIPTAKSEPEDIAGGADGNLWFTEESGNQIGRITTAGVITEFPIPTAASAPFGIVPGPDGMRERQYDSKKDRKSYNEDAVQLFRQTCVQLFERPEVASHRLAGRFTSEGERVGSISSMARVSSHRSRRSQTPFGRAPAPNGRQAPGSALNECRRWLAVSFSIASRKSRRGTPGAGRYPCGQLRLPHEKGGVR